MPETKNDRVLDARGLLCPMPVVKTKLALEDMEAGQVLKVLATDPASPKDFDAWTRETGNQLLESTREGKVFVFVIRKGQG